MRSSMSLGRIFQVGAVAWALCALATLATGCDRVGEKPESVGIADYRADLDVMCRLADELAAHEPLEDRARAWAVAVDAELETESVKVLYGDLPSLPREHRYAQIVRGAQGLGLPEWQCPQLERFWAELAAQPASSAR